MTDETLYEQASDLSLPEITCAVAHHIGFSPRLHAEEAHALCQAVATAGGLYLQLGIITDGFGGTIGSKHAGQYILEAVFQAIQASPEIDLSTLLYEAIQGVHGSLQQAAVSNMRLRQTGASITVAAIDMESMLLYLVHVGSNRAYLVRRKACFQLSVDMAGPASYVGAPGIPVLEIALGIQPDSEAAEYLELYEQDTLPLEPGDVIVLCSDGFAALHPDTGTPFVDSQEITRTVRRQDPENAAAALVNLALSRQVHDNVTAAILEMPGKRKPVSPAVWVGVLILLALILLAVGNRTGLFRNPAQQAALTASPTLPPPTDIPTPDIAAGYAELLYFTPDAFNAYIPGGDSVDPAIGDRIPFGAGVRIWTTDAPAKLALSDGTTIYLDAETSVYMTRLAPPGDAGSYTTLTIEQGNLLVLAERLQVNAVGELYQTTVQDGVMGVSFSQAEASFQVDCLGGTCQAASKAQAAPIMLNAGSRGSFERLLPSDPAAAQYDPWMLLGGLDVPRPTATPTFTPTNTPTPTLTPTPTPRPTATIYIPPPTQPGATDRPDHPNPTSTPDSGGG